MERRRIKAVRTLRDFDRHGNPINLVHNNSTEVALKVRSDYLGDETGVVAALQDGLRRLFSLDRLPDNPHLMLANYLYGYIDRGELWGMHPSKVAADIDSDSLTDMVEATTQLCELVTNSNAVGLPHILRLAAADNIRFLHRIMLSNHLPQSFFDRITPQVYDGGSLEVVCSLQHDCVLHRYNRRSFAAAVPSKIIVRADVLVAGENIDDAYAAFYDQVLADLLDLRDASHHVVTAVTISKSPQEEADLELKSDSDLELQDAIFSPEELLEEADYLGYGDPGTVLAERVDFAVRSRKYGPRGDALAPGTAYDDGTEYGTEYSDDYSDDYGPPISEPDSLASSQASDEDKSKVYQLLKRWVLRERSLEVHLIVAVEISDLEKETREITGGVTHTLTNAIKRYYFHFRELAAGAAVGAAGQTVHLASVPHAALYQGVFLDQGAALAYMKMHNSSESPPYVKETLKLNKATMVKEIQAYLNQGKFVDVFRVLLLGLMLDDPLCGGAGKLGAVGTLEQLVSSGEPVSISMIPLIITLYRCQATRIYDITLQLQSLRDAVLWLAQQKAIEITLASQMGSRAGSRRSRPVRSKGSTRTGSSASRNSSQRAGRRPRMAGRLAARIASAETSVQSTLGSVPETMNTDEMLDESDARVAQRVTRAVGDHILRLRPQIIELVANGVLSDARSRILLLCSALPSNQLKMQSVEELDQLAVQLSFLRDTLLAAHVTIMQGMFYRCPQLLTMFRALNLQIDISLEQVTHGTEASSWLLPTFKLNVPDLIIAQVEQGSFSSKLGREGVLAQYSVDSLIHELIRDVYLRLTDPPMRADPFPRLLSLIREKATKLDLWARHHDSDMEQNINELSLVSSAAFIYSAHRQLAEGEVRKVKLKPKRVVRRQPGRVATEEGMDELPQVFGSYAAVQLAHAELVHFLATSLPRLLASFSWQDGAYQVDVIRSFMGDIVFGRAIFNVMEDPQRRAYLHNRFYKIEIDEFHLVAGPKRKDAAKVFAKGFVQRITEDTKHTAHVLHQIEIGGAVFEQSDFTNRSEAVQAALVSAVRYSQVDNHVASLDILAHALEDRVYVHIQVKLFFQHAPVAGVLERPGADVRARPWSGRPWSGRRPPSAGGMRDNKLAFWDDRVYRRVFRTAKDAMTWYQWNNGRGDPAQPFHVAHISGVILRRAVALRDAGKHLESHRALLLWAVIRQDTALMLPLAKCMFSAAQELKTTLELGGALSIAFLNTDPAFRNCVNEVAVTRIKEIYVARVRRVVAASHLCHYSGIAKLIATVLPHWSNSVGHKTNLVRSQAQALAAMQTWIACSKDSMAASFSAIVRYDILKKPIEKLLEENRGGQGLG